MRYGMFRPLLTVLGAGPKFSKVEIDGDRLRVRMGLLFKAEVPLAAITSVGPDTQMVGGIGVHGGRGNWLVNGAARGIVRIEIEPPARAKVMGVPVRLRILRVGVKSPGDLIAALRR